MKLKRKLLIATLAVAIGLELVFQFTGLKIVQDEVMNELVTVLITRLITGFGLLFILRELGYVVFEKIKLRHFWFILPFLAVAINNLPIASLIIKEAYVIKPVIYVFVLALSCIAVALAEETTFRGILFNFLLEEKKEKSLFWVIIVQAAVFAFIHVFNLLFGAGFIDVILQVGYTFLFGAMLAVVLYKTKNIWFCISLHAVYNFGGLLLPTLGAGTWFNPITIVITAVLAVGVLIYVLIILNKEQAFRKRQSS